MAKFHGPVIHPVLRQPRGVMGSTRGRRGYPTGGGWNRVLGFSPFEFEQESVDGERRCALGTGLGGCPCLCHGTQGLAAAARPRAAHGVVGVTQELGAVQAACLGAVGHHAQQGAGRTVKSHGAQGAASIGLGVPGAQVFDGPHGSRGACRGSQCGAPGGVAARRDPPGLQGQCQGVCNSGLRGGIAMFPDEAKYLQQCWIEGIAQRQTETLQPSHALFGGWKVRAAFDKRFCSARPIGIGTGHQTLCGSGHGMGNTLARPQSARKFRCG